MIHNNINSARRELEQRLAKVAISSAIQTFNNIIVESPVDTGRFRSNWQASINTPITSETSGGDIEDVAGKLADWNIKDTAYLTNNLPYAEPLEYGWSKQRPSGWVRANVEKGQAALDKAVATEQ